MPLTYVSLVVYGLNLTGVDCSCIKNLPCSKTLEEFREGKIQVLVSSDGMTRGMDVEGVKNVINYDMPKFIKTYIHRAGRTARAGQTGCCFTLLRKEEVCCLFPSLRFLVIFSACQVTLVFQFLCSESISICWQILNPFTFSLLHHWDLNLRPPANPLIPLPLELGLKGFVSV